MDWSDILPHVLPSVKECPETVAIDHIVKAARLFAQKSLVWRRTSEPFLTIANQRTYPLDIDEPTEELIRVIDAYIGDVPYDISDGISGPARVRRQSHKNFMYVVDRTDVIVNPAPSLPNLEIVLTLALKPTLVATVVPEELESFAEDIAHGAIASLCALPREGLYDEKQTALHANIFSKRITSAGMLASGGNAAGKRRSRVRFF